MSKFLLLANTDIFNVNQLESPIRDLLPKMAGFTSSFLIVSSPGAIFPWHIEEQVTSTPSKTYNSNDVENYKYNNQLHPYFRTWEASTTSTSWIALFPTSRTCQ